MKKALPVIFIIILVLLVQCSDTGNKAKVKGKVLITVPVEPVNQESLELDKAFELKVKERRTYSYFYDKFGKSGEKSYLVEKIVFNENGLKTDYYQYVSNGIVDIHNSYEYDDYGNIIKTTTFDGADQMKFRRTSEFDEEGHEIHRKELNIKTNEDDIFNIEYDSLYNPLKIIKTNSEGDLLSAESFIYDSLGRMTAAVITGKNNYQISRINYTYDSLGHVGQEIHPRATSSTIITYKYDSAGRVIESDAGYLKREYEFYDSGDLKMEAMYSNGGYLQQKFTYEYDARGLVTEKIRYDGMGNPAILIKYEYDFN